ncbi:hypothetical protein HIM_02835 [Hirsutella minnesotensis 3608]|nr:hypothetical protein HIM_02835 [Hirsutella minnesotensis 3608]
MVSQEHRAKPKDDSHRPKVSQRRHRRDFPERGQHGEPLSRLQLPKESNRSIEVDGPEDAKAQGGNFTGYCGITNTELVSSYNWISGDGLKIVIPGKPPIWTLACGPQQIARDMGKFPLDLNDAIYPEHAVEPAVLSVMKMRPNPLSVDLVACIHTLENLLDYVDGRTHFSFKILVEAVGETVHLIRCDPKSTYMAKEPYIHHFVKANTSWSSDFVQSISHHRVVKYQLGGLNLLMRSESKAYDNTVDLSFGLENLSLGKSIVPRSVAAEGLQVDFAGSLVPQSAILEIKTRSSRTAFKTFKCEVKHLWLLRVSQLVHAKHDRGLFDAAQIKDMNNTIRLWEATNQKIVHKFADLLRQITRRALANKGGKLLLVKSKDAPLEFRAAPEGMGDAFSDSVGKQWEEWLQRGRGETSASHGYDEDRALNPEVMDLTV